MISDCAISKKEKKGSSRRIYSCFFTHNGITTPKTTREGQESTTKTSFAFSLTSKVQEPSAFHNESSKQVPRSWITSTRLQAEISKLAWPRRSHPARSTRVYNVLAYFYADYFDAGTPAPRGKIKSVRTHSEVSEQFDSFSLLKLLFLVRNWHCWSRKAFTRQMRPQIREKNCENGRFSTALTGMKSCTVDRGCTPAPKDATKLAVFLSLFSSLSFDISIKKQHAEVIFRLSRPVLCKNQENGSGKQ